MTDADKVALCRTMIGEFWEYVGEKNAATMEAVLTAVSTVLDFKEDGKDG